MNIIAYKYLQHALVIDHANFVTNNYHYTLDYFPMANDFFLLDVLALVFQAFIVTGSVPFGRRFNCIS